MNGRPNVHLVRHCHYNEMAWLKRTGKKIYKEVKKAETEVSENPVRLITKRRPMLLVSRSDGEGNYSENIYLNTRNYPEPRYANTDRYIELGRIEEGPKQGNYIYVQRQPLFYYPDEYLVKDITQSWNISWDTSGWMEVMTYVSNINSWKGV